RRCPPARAPQRQRGRPERTGPRSSPLPAIVRIRAPPSAGSALAPARRVVMHLAGWWRRIPVVLLLVWPRLTPSAAVLRPALLRPPPRPAGGLAAVRPPGGRPASAAPTAPLTSRRTRVTGLIAVAGPASVIAAHVTGGRREVAARHPAVTAVTARGVIPAG